MTNKVNIPTAEANSLVQTLADLLDEATHQIWHATQDPESFNRETAWTAYLDIKKRASAAVETAFSSADEPNMAGSGHRRSNAPKTARGDFPPPGAGAAHEPSERPTAWMQRIVSIHPGEPDEVDYECYAGDEPPGSEPDWIPLYRHPVNRDG
jgi:hypothetical protein